MHQGLNPLALSCLQLTSPDYREWISPREALEMVIEGGAAALGLSDKIGKLQVGFDADLVS